MVARVAIFIHKALRVLPTRSFLNIAYDVVHDLILGRSSEFTLLADDFNRHLNSALK